MRSIVWALLVGAALAATPAREPRQIIRVTTVEELKAALRGSPRNVSVELAPGNYSLSAETTDVETGHCSDHIDVFPATAGLKLSGEHLWLVGAAGDVTLTSDAIQDIYFNDCADCLIEGITIRAVRTDWAAGFHW